MTSVRLTDYEPIVGKQTLDELYLLAEELKGKRIKIL